MLSPNEMERYKRQLPVFGEDGQAKLKQASAFIAGAGGLGSPLAFYLAAAGVGRLRIVDRDRVSLNNLNRQVLHCQNDVGREKAASAGEKLCRLNTDIKIEAISETITDDNIDELAAGCGLILDAMDNFPTRYLLNRYALKKGIPFFHGAVEGFYGQAATIIPGRTACLRCIFPEVYPQEPPPVVGVTCGVIGSIQAGEALKYITGKGRLLENRLLMWDGLRCRMEELPVARDPGCRDCHYLEVL